MRMVLLHLLNRLTTSSPDTTFTDALTLNTEAYPRDTRLEPNPKTCNLR